MMKIFGVVILLINLSVLSLAAGTASAAGVTLPHTQHWNAVSPWKQVFGGSALDGSASAPGSASTSLRFEYSSGMSNGHAPDKVWVNFAGQSELWTRYYFKYSSNYYFHPIDNKQAYWYIQNSSLSTNWYVSCSSNRKMRMVFQRGSQGSGTRWSNTGYNPTIERNVWYEITTRVVLNTGEQSNGIFQMWINGKLVIDARDVPFLVGPDVGKKVNSMAFDPVFGGNSGESKPATDYFWVDFTNISTKPIGSGNPPPPNPDGRIPRPPANMQAD
jgi:hypothetical protein